MYAQTDVSSTANVFRADCILEHKNPNASLMLMLGKICINYWLYKINSSLHSSCVSSGEQRYKNKSISSLFLISQDTVTAQGTNPSPKSKDLRKMIILVSWKTAYKDEVRTKQEWSGKIGLTGILTTSKGSSIQNVNILSHDIKLAFQLLFFFSNSRLFFNLCTR